jgi:hypothetical protein
MFFTRITLDQEFGKQLRSFNLIRSSACHRFDLPYLPRHMPTYHAAELSIPSFWNEEHLHDPHVPSMTYCQQQRAHPCHAI